MSPLPFRLEQIDAIAWESGSDTCEVTYFDPEDREMKNKKVLAGDLDALRPAFKRFLVCANVCAGGDSRDMAVLVKKWDILLRKEPHEAYTLSNNQIFENSLFREATVSASPYRVRHLQQLQRIVFGAGITDVIDRHVLEANYPGIISGLKVLCQGGAEPTVRDFQVFIDLAAAIPYAKLEANAISIEGLIQSCVAAGVPIYGMGTILANSMTLQDVNDALPDLDGYSS